MLCAVAPLSFRETSGIDGIVRDLGVGALQLQTAGMSDITGSLGEKTEASRAADPRGELDLDRDRYRANPKDPDAALQYGKALRATGQRSQAVAVLEQATIAHPDDKALLAGYGRALADNGNFQQAFDVLGRAHTPEDPDWRILSAQGAVLDQLGRYEEARQYYASALKIVPEEPIGAVQSRPFVPAFKRSAQGGGDVAPRLQGARMRIRACGRIWRWWSACGAVSPRPKAS